MEACPNPEGWARYKERKSSVFAKKEEEKTDISIMRWKSDTGILKTKDVFCLV